MRAFRFLMILLCSTELKSVEILEADPVLSGRLIGPESVDAVFGSDSWDEEFRLNDYLVGSIRSEAQIEGAVLFAFRINENFLDELSKEGAAQFLFTIPSFHEGDAEKVLPVDVLLLQRNAGSAQQAAEVPAKRILGSIAVGELVEGRLYRFEIDDFEGLQVGDVVWVGLNGRNPLEGENHNFLVGGDLVSLPGSVPPMLVAGSEKALSETVLGMSSLTLLHRRLNAPAKPGMEWKKPANESRWVNPFTSQGQLDRLQAIDGILRRELEKLPTARRSFGGDSFGFRSSVKQEGESWSLKLPVDGVATAICLVPALFAEGDAVKPFAFPKRFSIVAQLPEGEGEVVIADWRSEDFALRNTTPVVFSFPWRKYDSIEFKVVQGERSEEGHFFALEELFLYRPVHEEQIQTRVEISEGDSVEAKPFWSAEFLTDGKTSLGPTLMEKAARGREEAIAWEVGALAEPEMILALPKKQSLWSIQLYPLIDSGNWELPSQSFPRQLTIEFANDAKFSEVVSTVDAAEWLRPVPVGGNPLSIRFEAVEASFLRLRFGGLMQRDGKPLFGLAEIRVNEAQRLGEAEILLRGFPATVEARSFIDDHANGYRLGEQLPWVIRLIRRDVVTAELAEVEAGMAVLRSARQRTFRLLAVGVGGALVTLFSGILFWQKRKNRAENLRVRRRIQQDLHDEIGSHLGTVSLVTSHLMRGDLPGDVREELSDVNRSAREATSSLREVIWLTDKSILTLDKAFTYMQMRAEQMVHDCNLVMEVSKNVPSQPITSVFKRNLFLLFTEAIHNCQKHAEASTIQVLLAVEGGQISMRVVDDGRGFSSETVQEGIGLQSMRERAEQLGGELKISSEPSVGTTVHFTTKIQPAK